MKIPSWVGGLFSTPIKDKLSEVGRGGDGRYVAKRGNFMRIVFLEKFDLMNKYSMLLYSILMEYEIVPQ